VTSGSNVEGADAAEAIRFAERAVELTRQRDPDALDVLAAAYAMAGDFSRAVEAAEAALALTSATNDVQQSMYIRDHLEDYRRHLR
jgi:spermidine synthase